MTEDVSTVRDKDVVALRLLREEELVWQLVVLEQKAVIRSHEEIRGVSVGCLLYQVDEVTKGVISCFEDLSLGPYLVACGVNSVVVDVEHLVVLEQLAPFFRAKCPEVLRLDSGAAYRLDDLRAGACSVCRFVVDEDGLPVD